MSEINPLQDKLDQANNTIKNVAAQLDAAKQMINEGTTTSHTLRTNLNLLIQENQTLNIAKANLANELAQCMKQIDDLKAKNNDITDSIESTAE